MSKKEIAVDYPWVPPPPPPPPKLAKLKLIFPRAVGAFASGIRVGQSFSCPVDLAMELIAAGTAEPLDLAELPGDPRPPAPRSKWKCRLLRPVTVKDQPGVKVGDIVTVGRDEFAVLQQSGSVELLDP